MTEKDSVHKLIYDLDEKYPDKAPLEERTPFELGELAGQRKLIETLKAKYKVGKVETIEKEV